MSGSRRKPGPLGPFVEGYRVWLLGRGYSASVVIRSLIALGHLGRWMEREALAVDQLTAAAVSAFLAEYRSSRGRLPNASVWPLLEYLRAEGAVPPEPRATASPLEQLVGEYREWLLDERGLSPVTVHGSEQLARRFLAQRVIPGDPCGVRGITAADVNDFLVRECARVSPASAGCFIYRLRSLLRYLAVRGVADPGLALAVPRVAHWRQATIPQFPTRPDIDRLLASCDRDNATGARDYAVLLLLARLGLRAVEVSRLQLDDFDWRAGELTVDGKGHRRDRLPLPGDVGEAMVAHLTHRGRRRGEPRVFLTVHAPIRPLEPSGVRTIVRSACRRASIEPVPAHRLRHALASDLLREGASMIDIGQVLRHNQLESTAIYAKVDLGRLRRVASPWPGAVR
jgi:site-specific recombinase XerD